ncbi:enoyl-CoA-hydratase DpgD [Streptomyces sp. MA5143a]|uniref:enoyl-CoA-hydratase DpgD n=1 Tax=Streptomyces sp. MA5143a TaxID=2083010 RepID=UPI000D198D3A|nr:enoyl-CoA-hydratase DpgD [Streptomyces sp. MA5143a]SPE99913.1 Carnitinyl-CoA dehydratase [Streptomyces sp. MA5143a]
MLDALQCVRYEKRDRVAYITLDRPQVLNAMNLRMHAELAAVWDDFEADDDIWVGVLTGAGERSFSVGQDLKELVRRVDEGTATSTFGSRDKPGWPRLTERFSMFKPLIARVNGYALGGGFELALACDIVIAAEHAQFALTEAKLGLIAGAGGLFRLTRQAPFRAAMGHLLTGRRMTAARAYELGLVNEVVAADELDACLTGWMEDVLSCAPLSLRAAKEAATVSATMPLDRAFATRYAWEERRMHSQDALEGPRAFVEKRPPKWTGS